MAVDRANRQRGQVIRSVKRGSAGQRKEERKKELRKETNARTTSRTKYGKGTNSFPSRDFEELICENRKAIAAFLPQPAAKVKQEIA